MNDSFHNSNRIYFDCNATTPILKDACQAVLCTMEKVYGNPSSTHMAGAEAKMILQVVPQRLFKFQFYLYCNGFLLKKNWELILKIKKY